MRYKWKPNKAQKAKFLETLENQDSQLEQLKKWKPECDFRWNDNKSSLYFEWNNIDYRISTHHLPSHKENDLNKYRNYKPLLGNEKTIEIVTNSRDNIILKAKEVINKQQIK